MNGSDGKLSGLPRSPPEHAYLPWSLPEDRGCSAQREPWQCVSGKSASHWDMGREAFKDSIV